LQGQRTSLSQISYDNFYFIFSKIADIGLRVFGHTQRVSGGVCHYAKFEQIRCSRFDNTQVMQHFPGWELWLYKHKISTFR